MRFAVPVACIVGPPPTKVIEGTLVYPLPGLVIDTAAIVPVVKSTCAVPVAVTPPAPRGGSNDTDGALVYPTPGLLIVTLPTDEKYACAGTAFV